MKFRYALGYKPFGTLCAHRDKLDRPTLTTMGVPAELHPAGRLDMDSEGLVLLTDDGQMFHRITHPHFAHAKTYFVLVIGEPDQEALSTLRNGVEIKLGMTQPADVEVIKFPPAFPPFPQPVKEEGNTWLRLVLREGMNRQVKRMTAAVGHPTLRLIRVGIGPLSLPPDLQPGMWRELTLTERKVLLDWVNAGNNPRGRKPTGHTPRRKRRR